MIDLLKRFLESKNKFSSLISCLYRITYRREINSKALQIINEENLLIYLDRYNQCWNNIYCTESKTEYSETIWTCWLQGEKKAPALVKRCIESMRNTGRNVIVLDKTNFEKYVNLPQYIIEKWEQKIISDTHISDIIRVAVLCDYGGCWLDATVLLMGDRDAKLNIDYVFDNNFFVVKSPMTIESPRVCSSWMIRTLKNNQIISCVKKILYEYWKENDDIRDYFLLHMCFVKVLEREDNKALWKKIPYFDDSYSNLLRYYQNDVFVDEIWRDVISKTSIHKLNRKYEIKEIENSFYFSVINKK